MRKVNDIGNGDKEISQEKKVKTFSPSKKMTILCTAPATSHSSCDIVDRTELDPDILHLLLDIFMSQCLSLQHKQQLIHWSCSCSLFTHPRLAPLLTEAVASLSEEDHKFCFFLEVCERLREQDRVEEHERC